MEGWFFGLPRSDYIFFCNLVFCFQDNCVFEQKRVRQIATDKVTKSMCVARLNNYMSFFANAVKINRSAIFPTCLFFFFCKSWLNMCRQTGLCCVFWWHFVLPIMLLSRFFSYIISQQTFVGRGDIVALAKHGSFEFLNFSLSLIWLLVNANRI